MTGKKRGSQQGSNTGKSRGGGKSRRNKIRRAKKTARQAASARRQAIANASGTMDKSSAMDALKSMGFKVNADGPVNMAEARATAEGAAVSAAQALGVNIRKADGSIDTQKARAAIGAMLGFSIEADGKKAQQAATKRAEQAAVESAIQTKQTAIEAAQITAQTAKGADQQTAQAALETAKALNVDIRDRNGNIDTNKARQVAELALDLKIATAKQLGRREAMQALNTSLEVMSHNPESRRAASDAVEKLLSSSVLVDGKISRRKALDIMKNFNQEHHNASQ